MAFQRSPVAMASAFKEEPKGTATTFSSTGKALQSRRSKGRWFWLLLALATLAAIAVVPRITSQPPLVSVEAASVQDLTASFTAEAYVKGKEYDLSLETPGRIAKLYVKEGQAVKAGQTLLRLDDSEPLTLLDQARAADLAAQAAVKEAGAQVTLAAANASARSAGARSNLRQAEAKRRLLLAGARTQEISQAQQRVEQVRASMEDAQKANVRAQMLYKQGAIARANADATEARYKSATAELKQAQAAVSLLKAGPRPEEVQAADAAVDSARAEVALAQGAAQEIAARKDALAAAKAQASGADAAVKRAQAVLEKLEIKAPDDGIISKVVAEQGMQVTPGVAALTLSSRRDLRIDAEISTEDAAKAHPGMAVSVTSPAYPGRNFAAKLVSLSPVGELKPDAAIRTRIVRARVELVKDWPLFRPGMEVDVEGSSVLRKTMLISGDALMLSGNETSVWVLGSDRKVTKRTVTTGFSNATQTEILSGLKQGDRVVVSGKETLKEGQTVRIRK